MTSDKHEDGPDGSAADNIDATEPPPLTPGSIPDLGAPPIDTADRDERYFALLSAALQSSARYKPMFGQGRKGGLTLEQFQTLYRADPFYSWIGLDSPLMYAAHKAAGGMTSIYRQVGIGAQWIFSYVLQDALGLSKEQAVWSYQVPMPSGKPRTLTLDGRIELAHVQVDEARARVHHWMYEIADKLMLDRQAQESAKGLVFEVRQGYKSKDSKRQNADISNASNAYANHYIPVLMLFSSQIDGDVAIRYTQAQWLLLVGSISGQATNSTYVFCREVLGYDLAGFYERNSTRIKVGIESVLQSLLSPTIDEISP